MITVVSRFVSHLHLPRVFACLLAFTLASSECPIAVALDLVSLQNCALPNTLQLNARIGDSPTALSLFIGSELIPGCGITVPEPFTASIDFLNGGNTWLAVSPQSGVLQQGVRNTIRVVFTPAGLPRIGTYQAIIQLRLPSINGTLSIPVSAALAPASAKLSLSQSALLFQTVARSAQPPASTITLLNTGVGAMDWFVNSADVPSWLTIGPRSGSLPTGDQAGTTISLGPNTGALDEGVYAALIPFRSNAARNSPQYVSVTYRVVSASSPPIPHLSSYGLRFSDQVASTSNQQNTLLFSNLGGGVVTAQFTATSSSGNWLAVSPSVATAVSGSPVTLQVTVNATGLSGTTHVGRITANIPTRAPLTVDVAYTVTPDPRPPEPPEPPVPDDDSSPPPPVFLAGCTPSSAMSLVSSTVGNGISSPVSFPQVLLVQLLDSCTEPVANGTVAAVVAGSVIPMSSQGGGYYSGTWTPSQVASSVSVTFMATHPVFSSVQQSYTVSSIAASAAESLPVLFDGGVVEGISFAGRRPLVPGGIVSLFGSRLAAATAPATQIPLERLIGQTSVRIGNYDAPLYFVSPNQINAQIPYELRPGDIVPIVVNVAGRLTSPQTYLIAAAQPGIFTDSLGPVILDDQNRRVTPSNPARIGRVIQIFAGGLGDTIPQAGSGDALPGGSAAAVPVSVLIGGVETPVQYDGLAPGFVGLYQINATIPGGIRTGPAIPIQIRQNGISGNPNQSLTIPVSP